jgi:hypothetical protein
MLLSRVDDGAALAPVGVKQDRKPPRKLTSAKCCECEKERTMTDKRIYLVKAGKGACCKGCSAQQIHWLIKGHVYPAPMAPTPTPDPAAAKDTTKPRLSLLEGDFLAEMADTMAEGIRDGRSAGSWKDLDWTPETRASYMDALLRHTLLDFDAAAVACNAMIISYNDAKVKQC